MILEGIVTTLNADRSPNLSPMGPRVDESMSQFVLRPFRTARTYQNLQRTGQGVLHVTDDVELLARAAVDRLEKFPEMIPAESVDGWILSDACRWYAFRVSSLDNREERSTIVCTVVQRGTIRDFFGFNRAKHAVVEAAILATRLAFLPHDEVIEQYGRLSIMVQKTAGPQERRAFSFLEEHVGKYIASQRSPQDPALPQSR